MKPGPSAITTGAIFLVRPQLWRNMAASMKISGCHDSSTCSSLATMTAISSRW